MLGKNEKLLVVINGKYVDKTIEFLYFKKDIEVVFFNFEKKEIIRRTNIFEPEKVGKEETIILTLENDNKLILTPDHELCVAEDIKYGETSLIKAKDSIDHSLLYMKPSKQDASPSPFYNEDFIHPIDDNPIIPIKITDIKFNDEEIMVYGFKIINENKLHIIVNDFVI